MCVWMAIALSAITLFMSILMILVLVMLKPAKKDPGPRSALIAKAFRWPLRALFAVLITCFAFTGQSAFYLLQIKCGNESIRIKLNILGDMAYGVLIICTITAGYLFYSLRKALRVYDADRLSCKRACKEEDNTDAEEMAATAQLSPNNYVKNNQILPEVGIQSELADI